jgi:hypothetical protein
LREPAESTPLFAFPTFKKTPVGKARAGLIGAFCRRRP